MQHFLSRNPVGRRSGLTPNQASEFWMKSGRTACAAHEAEWISLPALVSAKKNTINSFWISLPLHQTNGRLTRGPYGGPPSSEENRSPSSTADNGSWTCALPLPTRTKDQFDETGNLLPKFTMVKLSHPTVNYIPSLHLAHHICNLIGPIRKDRNDDIGHRAI